MKCLSVHVRLLSRYGDGEEPLRIQGHAEEPQTTRTEEVVGKTVMPQNVSDEADDSNAPTHKDYDR